MKVILFFIVLYVSTMSQENAGTSIKINHAEINTTDETLILHGINFDYFGPYIRRK